MARSRKDINVWNGLAVLACLLMATGLARLLAQPEPHPVVTAPGERSGQTMLQDASGRSTPLRRFRRIASASMVADPILLSLCEPDRIAAFSSHVSRIQNPERFAGKPQVDVDLRPESIVTLFPDLLIVNNLARIEALQRLRESGVTVFDLGPMKGVESLLENIAVIGKLVGEEEKAAALATDFMRRMRAIAPTDVDAGRKPGAMYLAFHGGLLSGGTRGSSFHDVLVHAGFRDQAADTHQGWPRYGVEQLLQLNPEIIVTQEGMGPALCRQAGLDRLQGCRQRQVIELPADLILDPGLAMIDAALFLRRAYLQMRAVAPTDPHAR